VLKLAAVGERASEHPPAQAIAQAEQLRNFNTVLALIASFGGLIVFGASGLILGPAVIAVTLALVNILKNRFA
jgi:predicted PurR-regulated permease PerM